MHNFPLYSLLAPLVRPGAPAGQAADEKREVSGGPQRAGHGQLPLRAAAPHEQPPGAHAPERDHAQAQDEPPRAAYLTKGGSVVGWLPKLWKVRSQSRFL